MLCFDSFKSNTFSISTGIPQGSPLSPILYLFYNADLLETCADPTTGTSTIGYIDDVAILAISDSTEENCQILANAHEKAKKWAQQHASVFAEGKYELVHFARRQTPLYPITYDINHPLILPEVTVHPSKTCRYLGVVLDSELHWKAHLQKVEASASRRLSALARLAGSTWGTGLLGMRQLYIGAVLSQALYCASVWHAQTGELSYQKRGVKILEKIQYRAGKIIAGAYKATSKPAIDMELYLLPARQRLKRTVGDSLLRMLCTPASYILHKAIAKGIARALSGASIPRHPSPLEQSLHYYRYLFRNETLDNVPLETIDPHIVPPWWEPPQTTIAPNKDEATKRHNEITIEGSETLAIYTDGSSINGKVGTAAIVPELDYTIRIYMGLDTTSTVYAAELQGVLAAIQVAGTELKGRPGWENRKVAIFIDSQAAIRATQDPRRQSGQYILRQIVDMLQIIQEKTPGAKIELHWIPAHTGVEGNERADIAAKEAAGWKKKKENPLRRRQNQNARTPREELDTPLTVLAPYRLCQLKSAAKVILAQRVKVEWERVWEQETRGRALYRTIRRPTKDVLKLHRSIPKALSSIIVQLRTEKIGLKLFLYQRGVPGIDDGLCACRRGLQSVKHVLLSCPHYAGLRKSVLWKEEKKTTDLRTLLSTPALAIKAAKFMAQTKLLGHIGVPS
jgi:ribonuclease HI